MGDVGKLNAGGLELIADAVGLGVVLGLLRVLTRLDLGLDLGVGLTGLEGRW